MNSLPRTSPPRTLEEAIGQIDALWELVDELTTKLEEQQARNDELSAQLTELLAKEAGKSELPEQLHATVLGYRGTTCQPSVQAPVESKPRWTARACEA